MAEPAKDAAGAVPPLSVRQLVDRYRTTQAPPSVPFLIDTTGEEPSNLPPGSAVLMAHNTLAGARQSGVIGAAAPVARPGAAVYLIEKSNRNPFGDMITIGRALNNDVVINDAGVSKFHAYFRAIGTTMRLYDAGSTNGSRVDGRECGKDGLNVATLAKIELGPTRQLVFIAREDAREWLDAASGGKLASSPPAGSPVAPPTDPKAATAKLAPSASFGARVASTAHGAPFDPSTVRMRNDGSGSLASEPLEQILRRLQRDKWTGRVEVQIPDRPPIVLSLAGGAMAGFRFGDRNGTREELDAAFAARVGVFVLRE